MNVTSLIPNRTFDQAIAEIEKIPETRFPNSHFVSQRSITIQISWMVTGLVTVNGTRALFGRVQLKLGSRLLSSAN